MIVDSLYQTATTNKIEPSVEFLFIDEGSNHTRAKKGWTRKGLTEKEKGALFVSQKKLREDGIELSANKSAR